MVKIHNGVTYHSPTNTGKSATTKGLYFDLEIDDDAREIISSPSKRETALLDVTFIKPAKPKRSPSVITKTLKAVEVKKLISTMNFDKQNIKKVIDSFITETKNQCVGTNDLHRKSTKGEKIEKNTGNTKNRRNSKKDVEESIEDTIKQLFACPKSLHSINAIFERRNKTSRLSHKKSDTPYICESCALLDILKDSQKKPFISEVLLSPRNPEKKEERNSKSKERKQSNVKEKEYVHCEHYKQLLHKIKELEQRLQIHEKTTLPKNEFRELFVRQVKHKKEVKHRQKCECFDQPFSSEPFSVSEKGPRSSRNKEPRFCDKKTSPVTINYNFWQKGEEFLKPGIDFKNKIILLIENILKKLPRGNNKLYDDAKTV